jgi:hypothetical protein
VRGSSRILRDDLAQATYVKVLEWFFALYQFAIFLMREVVVVDRASHELCTSRFCSFFSRPWDFETNACTVRG